MQNKSLYGKKKKSGVGRINWNGYLVIDCCCRSRTEKEALKRVGNTTLFPFNIVKIPDIFV